MQKTGIRGNNYFRSPWCWYSVSLPPPPFPPAWGALHSLFPPPPTISARFYFSPETRRAHTHTQTHRNVPIPSDPTSPRCTWDEEWGSRRSPEPPHGCCCGPSPPHQHSQPLCATSIPLLSPLLLPRPLFQLRGGQAVCSLLLPRRHLRRASWRDRLCTPLFAFEPLCSALLPLQ